MHFEQMSMRNTATPIDMGHIPDEATAEVSQIVLGMELYFRSCLSGPCSWPLLLTNIMAPVQLSTGRHSLVSHVGSSFSRNAAGRGV